MAAKELYNIIGDAKTDLTYYYHYDPRGKLQAINGMLGSGADSVSIPLVSYLYNDALGLLDTTFYYAINPAKQVVRMDTIARLYDDRLRLTNINSDLMDYRLYYDNQNLPDANGFFVANDYSYNGNINGTTMQYRWDNNSNMTGSDMDSVLIYGYKYDKANRLYYADGLVGDYVIDPSYDYIHLNEQIGDATYTYDKIGNINTLKRVLPATKDTTTLIKDNMSYTYATGNNHLSSVSNAGSPIRYLGYDVNGNLITDSKKGITQTSYTRSHFPEKMTVNSENITYLYDANDSRMYKNVDTTLQEYYLKDLGVLDMKTGNWTYYLSGTERHLRIVPDSIHQPRLNATEPTIDFENDEFSFYETDHLGNTRVVFTPYKDYTWTYGIEFATNYYPYGKILHKYVNGDQEKYQLTGKQRDEETELDYFGARYYDSGLGKFLAPDPLGKVYPGWTPYRAFLDNPLYYTDKDGGIEWPIQGTNVIQKNKTEYFINQQVYSRRKGWITQTGNFETPSLTDAYKTYLKNPDRNSIIRTSEWNIHRKSTPEQPMTSPHIGTDFRASIGTQVYSLGDGEITVLNPAAGTLTVKYGNGDLVTFRHLNSMSEGLEVGSKVYEGQVIAESGKRRTTMPHLHVEAVDSEGKPVNFENRNYGTVTNEQFFNEYSGDYTKLPGYQRDHESTPPPFDSSLQGAPIKP